MFSKKEFRERYFKESASDDGFIRSHRDTNNFKNSSFFKAFPSAIRFQLFFDETEVTNPLGSKTKKHELGMFCFRIENLAPLENSRFGNIHPFAVCYSKHLKDSEFRFIIDELFKEMDILESNEEILLDIAEIPGFRINGTISSICGDTKGIHELFGFSSPSATKFCRLCLLSRD